MPIKFKKNKMKKKKKLPQENPPNPKMSGRHCQSFPSGQNHRAMRTHIHIKPVHECSYIHGYSPNVL